jgi:L-glutamine:2-deoxy-scyllo-inosose/3-amino-2,3-dideoxy-scyllo-inosose aminotransferase
MTEWQGAILRAQLRRFPEQHRTREERGKLLDTELAKVPGLRPQSDDPRMDSRARYACIVHYDPREFAGLPLAGFERALRAEGIEFGVSYPSLGSLELFRERRFSPSLRQGAPRLDYGALSLPHAEHAARSTVWLDHRMLLGDPDEVLDIVRAAARIQTHADKIARRVRRSETPAARFAGSLRRRLASGD